MSRKNEYGADSFHEGQAYFPATGRKGSVCSPAPEEQELYDLDRRNKMAYWGSIYLAEERMNPISQFKA